MKENKEKSSRFTIDISAKQHKDLKIAAAMHGLSMRQIIIQSIENQLQTLDTQIAKQSIEDKN